LSPTDKNPLEKLPSPLQDNHPRDRFCSYLSVLCVSDHKGSISSSISTETEEAGSFVSPLWLTFKPQAWIPHEDFPRTHKRIWALSHLCSWGSKECQILLMSYHHPGSIFTWFIIYFYKICRYLMVFLFHI